MTGVGSPRSRHVMTLLAAAGAVSLSPAHASAGSPELKKACVAAADLGQQLRSDGKLTAARDQFVRCSRDECPGPLRTDCAQWMNEVVGEMPSVVIGARDSAGHDIVAVRVFIDGKVASEQLDGKPIALDPGVHKFRYERSDGVAIEDQVVVRSGEQNRALTATFPSPPGTSPPPPLPSQSPPPPTASGAAPPPDQPSSNAAAWIFGGLGLVAGGAALYLDLSADSQVLDLRKSCAPNCEQSQVDSVRTRYVLAAVGAGVSAVSLGIATYLFISHSKKTSHPPTARFEVAPTRTGATAAVTKRF